MIDDLYRLHEGEQWTNPQAYAPQSLHERAAARVAIIRWSIAYRVANARWRASCAILRAGERLASWVRPNDPW